jgi:CheY-like chemotaxis protein
VTIDFFWDLRGVVVLVVEDEADARDFLVHTLEVCRASVHAAGGATEARDVLAAHTPNLIISDIGMPGEDGYSFLQSVRRLPDPHKRRIPAIALTAFTREQDAARAYRAGFDMHIGKPVQPRLLARAVAQLAAPSIAPG